MTQGVQRRFKTSERRRELSAKTRAKRKAAGKPVQPNVVDEALSAAVQASAQRHVKEGRSGRPVSPSELRVFDSLLAAALDHLIDIKGLDRDQSKAALQARLLKRRQYKNLPSKKG